MADDLRHRYAEALDDLDYGHDQRERRYVFVDDALEAVLAVRDEELERRRLACNAANAMAGVHKRCADRLRSELEHAKGALARDSEAMAGFMADHAEVLARAREQRDMWQRAAEKAEADLDRAQNLCARSPLCVPGADHG